MRWGGNNMRILFKSVLRKSLASFIVTTLLITIAISMAIVGTNILLNIGGFFEKKANELNSPDIIAVSSSKQNVIDEIGNLDGIVKAESEEIVYLPTGELNYSTINATMTLIFRDYEKERELGDIKRIDPISEYSGMGVYAPYKFYTTYGLNVNDVIKFDINGEEIEFTICGFYEDPLYGTPIYAIAQLYILDDYDECITAVKDCGGMVMDSIEYSIRLDSNASPQEMADEISSTIGNNLITIDRLDIMKGSVTMYPVLLSIVLVVIVLALLLVVMVVIKFSVESLIATSTVDIGIWRAIGWSSNKIVLIFAIQYFTSALIASVFGVVICNLILPSVSGIISSTIGLTWKIDTDIALVFFCCAVTTLLVLFISTVAAFKSKRVVPIRAINNQVDDKSKNVKILKLYSSRIGIDLFLSLKSLLIKRKQTISVFLISLLLVFVSSCCTIAYYNLCIEDSTLNNMIGYPQADICITMDMYGMQTDTSREDSKRVFSEISDLPEIESICEWLMLPKVSVDGNNGCLNVSDDFTMLKKNTLVDGQYPKRDNEVSVSFKLADMMNKNIGDSVDLKINGVTESFVITGITQQVYNSGAIIDITNLGFVRFDSDYTPVSIMAILTDGTNKSDFCNELEERYKSYSNFSITVNSDMVEPILSSLEMGVSALMLAMLAITLLIVFMIMSLIINLTLKREKKSIGINKALGFSVWRLCKQITYTVCIPMILGYSVGYILSVLLGNNLFGTVLQMVGIRNCQFTINHGLLIAVFGVLALVSLFMAMCLSIKLRKISVKDILAE